MPVRIFFRLCLFAVAGGLLLSEAGAGGAEPEKLSIVAPADPAKEEAQAVDLLTETLGKIYPERVEVVTGGEVPLTGPAIFVGGDYPGYPADGETARCASADALDEDGFTLIRHRPWRPKVGPRRVGYRPLRLRPAGAEDWLAIVGATPRGTYYGAAWLLREHYGVQWLFPGEDGLSLPETAPALLPRSGRAVEPSFEERRLGHSLSPEQKDWSLRNGLGSRFYYNHNLHRLTDQQLFKDNPDWQSEAWGRRTNRVTGKGPQPDLLSPGYQAHIGQQAAKSLDEHPGEQSVSLGITDSVTFDRSERTRSVVEPFRYFRGRPDYSDVIFGFTNAVALQLFEDGEGGNKYADRVLTQLAYYYAEEVPQIELQPQIMPWLTSDRAQWFDPEVRAGDEALIRRWEKTGVNKLGSWDYYEGIPFFIPRHYPTVIGESLPYLHTHGVRSFFAEGLRNPGLDDPKYWLAAQLLWDVDKAPAVLMDEYFERCYGEAAVPMRRFFDLCEQAWMDQPPPGRWIKYFTAPSQAELFPPELCRELRACLDDAQALAESDLIRRRIARVSDSFALTELAVNRYQTWRRLASQARVTSADAAEWLATESALNRAMTGQWRRSLPLFFLLRSNPTFRGTEPPEGAEPVLVESFGELLIPEPVVTARDYPGLVVNKAGEGEWELTLRNCEALRLAQSSQAAREADGGEGEGGLRVEGVEYFRLERSLSCAGIGQLYLRAWARGKLSGDAQVFASVRFQDAKGKAMGTWNMDALPFGEHGWLPLTVLADSPAGAATASITLVVQNQGPGDWIDWDDIALYKVPVR
ncbi:DUF4838 domain-containing protein [Ruficoccus amylovorans]|uniref:DUF4838 domain-containing protein n=1 Tax=Ruficoccus amylovorans TaxID=1804625 RepID=A0A842HJF8_9BACT|nr:DUF4838 domain-containing protein [Ruficoccus amylovorans]MBC2595627.1 DUF4838 domain-containing protein [Ruficoccus amylovorans]